MRLAEFITNKFFYGGSTTISDGFAHYTPSPYLFNIQSVLTNPTASRCLNMIIDAAADIDYEVKDGRKISSSFSQLQPESILTFLNRQANPYMDANFFKRALVSDLITDGNAFILVEGHNFYYLPASKVTIQGSKTKFVESYKLEEATFRPEQIIHIKDNSIGSIQRGESRLNALKGILELHHKMKDFQKNFFNNSAMPGIILMSDNTYTDKLKKRKLQEWAQDFNPTSGARKPAFLDGGITIENLGNTSFREMDFEASIQSLEEDIARCMGVPPILLEGGNNANISPNHRLFYLETIVPICKKISNAMSLYFGYKIVPELVGVPALQPDLRELANYVSTLVNGGVMYPNEGRGAVGLPKDDDPTSDELRIPANIAGSAADPSQGGRPKEPKPGEN